MNVPWEPVLVDIAFAIAGYELQRDRKADTKKGTRVVVVIVMS